MNIQITDQDLVQQIEQLAVAEHRSPEQIVAEALCLHTGQTQKIPGVAFCFRLPGRDIPARPIFLNETKQS